MREIEFRARLIKKDEDKIEGQWVYGLPQQLVAVRGIISLNKPAKIGYIVSHEPERMLQSGAPNDNLYWYEVDPDTLGQYTGFKDRTGKEIYEDDIIEWGITGDEKRDYRVIFDEGAWILQESGKLGRFRVEPVTLWNVHRFAAIVGNMHEHNA